MRYNPAGQWYHGQEKSLYHVCHQPFQLPGAIYSVVWSLQPGRLSAQTAEVINIGNE